MHIQRYWLGATVSITVAIAQSLSPSSCTITGGVAGRTTGWACTVNLTAGGAWTATPSSSDGIQVNICTYDINTASCTDTTSGTGNATLRVYAVLNETQAVGTFNKSVVIAGINLPVSVTISPRHFPPLYFASNGKTQSDFALAGCTRSDAAQVWVPYFDQCPVTTMAPSGSYKPPAVGSTYSDPTYGTTILHLADTMHSYSGSVLCSDEETPLCSIETGCGDDQGFYLMEAGHATPLYTEFCGSQVEFLPTHAFNVAYGLSDRTVWQFQSDGIYRTSAATAPNWGTPVKIWSIPSEITATQRNPQDGVTRDGWITAWGCLSGHSCNMSDPLAIENWRYLYTVNVYSGQQCRFDMQDPRVSYSVHDSMTTRDIGLTPFGPDGWSYIRILGTANPMQTLRWKRDCTWEWLGSRFTQSHNAGGIGQASNWAVQFDCPFNGKECADRGHHAQGYTGFYPFRLEPWNSDFLGFRITLFNESLTEQEAFEVGGQGPQIIGGSEDHHTCAGDLPLCVNAVEAGNGYVDVTAVSVIDTVTGTDIVNLHDSALGTLTTSDSLVVGCDTNAYPNMYGTFPVTSVSSLAITLGGGFDGTGYAAATHVCSAMRNSFDNSVHLKEGLSVTRFDRNGNPIQVWLVSKLMGVRYPAYFSEAHSQISRNGRWVHWASNIGYTSYISEWAAQIPWQMRATDQEELAPGYRVKVTGGIGSLDFSARVPDTANIACVASSFADLSGSTPNAGAVTLAGPSVDRTGSIGSLYIHSPYYWRCTTSNGDGRYVAVGTATTL